MDNPDNQAQDVNKEETETSDAPSSDEKTTQPEASTDVKDAKEEQTVPYSRFKEMNDKVKSLEEKHSKELEAIKEANAPKPEVNPQTEQIKSQLKEMGFVSKEEVDAEMAKSRADSKLAQDVTRLEKQYDGSDGRPKFDRDPVIKFAIKKQIGDIEDAYKIMNEKSLIDYAIKSASSKTGGVRSEASDGSSATAGSSNVDLAKAAMKGSTDAKATLMKRLAKGVLG